MELARRDSGTADRLVDELVPGDLDWRAMVRRYPIPSLLLAAGGGFLLGRRRGTGVFTALSAFAAKQLVEHINAFLGDEVL